MEIALNEVPLFIRSGKCIPLAESAEYVEAVDMEHMTVLGFAGAEYMLYEDDGVSRNYQKPEAYRRLGM